MTSHQDKVFVLRKIPYREADLILQCLSAKGERLSLMAYSALKSRKRFAGGLLDPTHYIHVTYRSRNDRMNELKEASLIEDFALLRQDYSRLEVALYLIRLIAQSTQEGEVHSVELFHLLGNALRATETSQHLFELKTHFEVKFLLYQGVLPEIPKSEILVNTPLHKHAEVTLSVEEWDEIQQITQDCIKNFCS